MPQPPEAKSAAKEKNRREINQHMENLPDILTAKHISDYLSISRRRVYELLQMSTEAGGIKSFDIGFSKRVEKPDFFKWVEERKQEKAQKNQAG